MKWNKRKKKRMPENVTNELLLEHLKAIQGRLSNLERGQSEIRDRLGRLEEGMASLSRRVDHLTERVERIERRLDLVDSPVQ